MHLTIECTILSKNTINYCELPLTGFEQATSGLVLVAQRLRKTIYPTDLFGGI